MLAHPITQAVISVCALVRAWDALDARVLRQCSNGKQVVAVRAALIGRLACVAGAMAAVCVYTLMCWLASVANLRGDEAQQGLHQHKKPQWWIVLCFSTLGSIQCSEQLLTCQLCCVIARGKLMQ